MYAQTVEVTVAGGLHARPAARFVDAAQHSASDVFVRNVTAGGSFVDAARALEVLGARVMQGDVIEIEAEGDDERKVVQTLVDIAKGWA